ncbi:hypothetical protein N9933_00045 [bacterium]|nr:hypothetical protein [bacterium]
MMRNLFYLLTCCLFFATGCTAPYYIPSSQHIPIIRKKGDLKLAGNLSLKGPDIHAAYAPAKGLAVRGTYSQRFGTTLENYNSYNHLVGELAIGRFSELGNNWYYETYIGYGRGRALGEVTSDIGCNCNMPNFCQCNLTEESLYHKGFLQGNVSWAKNTMEVGIAGKFSFVNMERTDKTNTGQISEEDLRNIFFEPGAVFRVGSEKVKFSIQLGLSIGLSEANIVHNPITGAIGLQYSPFGKTP